MGNERIIEHIRKRQDIRTELWSVRKILEMCKMGMYTQLCCDRIADEGKVDGKHVLIDWDEPGMNLAVDCRGFGKCAEILERYIGEDKWDEMFEAFWDRQEAIDNENRVIKMLRGMSMNDLRKTREEILKDKDNSSDRAELWITEEMRSRKLCNILMQKIKYAINYLRIRIKYHYVFDFLNRYEYKENY